MNLSAKPEPKKNSIRRETSTYATGFTCGKKAKSNLVSLFPSIYLLTNSIIYFFRIIFQQKIGIIFKLLGKSYFV